MGHCFKVVNVSNKYHPKNAFSLTIIFNFIIISLVDIKIASFPFQFPLLKPPHIFLIAVFQIHTLFFPWFYVHEYLYTLFLNTWIHTKVSVNCICIFKDTYLILVSLLECFSLEKNISPDFSIPYLPVVPSFG